MKHNLHIFTILCFFSLPLSLWAGDNGQLDSVEHVDTINLENLLVGRIAIDDIVTRCLKVADLIDEYANRPGLSEQEKRRFMNANRRRINNLQVKEKSIIRCARRDRKPPPNKHYFGDASRAVDATDKQLKAYDLITQKLISLKTEGALNNMQFEASMDNIIHLRRWHANNRVISKEMAAVGKSVTYGDGPSLHPEGREAPFEEKANIIFSELIRTLNFAKKYDYLPAMFIHFSHAGGCLEARFNTLQDWYRNFRQYQTQKERLNKDEVDNTIPFTSIEAVNGCIERNQDILLDVYHENKHDLAQQISEYFEGKICRDSKVVTPKLALNLIEGMFLLSP